MRQSLQIASIRGVPIRLHWSFSLLVLLALVPVGGHDRAAATAELLGWILALFACVVVHELAHCFVARRRGFVVQDIVLLPIGGASEIAGLPGPPADELAIALAGPAASVALAGALALVLAAFGARIWPPTLFTGPFPARLMWTNLLLAGFNLLPAIPMDGGRVLRAVLARRHGDLGATVIAARVGRACGFVLFLVGLRFDLWLCLIALFVTFGAGGEQRAAMVRSATGGLRVADVMVHDPTTLEVSFPLAAVAPFLQASPGRVLPVVDHGRYVGLTSADHLYGAGPGAVTVRDVTDTYTAALSATDPLYPAAVQTLLGDRRRAAAVLEDGHVVGVIYAPHVAVAMRRATAGTAA